MATIDPTTGKITEASTPTPTQYAASGKSVPTGTSGGGSLSAKTLQSIKNLGVVGQLPSQQVDTGLQYTGGAPIIATVNPKIAPTALPQSPVISTIPQPTSQLVGVKTATVPTVKTAAATTPTNPNLDVARMSALSGVSESAVRAEMAKGVNLDAAIGNVVMRLGQATTPIPPPPTAPSVPGKVEPKSPIQSTSDLRSAGQATINQASSLALDIAGSDIYSITQEQKDAQKKIDEAEAEKKRIDSGQYTDAERQRLAEVEANVRAQYAPLLGDAAAAKAQGEAKSLVNAGQAGGLMSTQMAGVAALLPTKGGVWAGAGGQLEEIKSAYDRNISNLNNQMISSINSAKDSALNAMRTGAKEDLTYAREAFQRAKDNHAQVLELTQAKQDALYAAQKRQKEMLALAKEDATETLDRYVEAGTASPEDFAQADQLLGVREGTHQKLFDVRSKAKQQELASKSMQNEIDFAKDVTGIMKDLPAGKSFKIGDTTYQGLSTAGTFHGTETDEGGNVTAWSFDPASGKTTINNLGQIGKSAGFQQIKTDDGRVLAWNPTTNEQKTIYDPNQPNGGVVDGGVINAFPEGTVLKRGECGEFVNDLTGLGVGDTFASKMDKMDKSINKDTAEVGDTVVTSYGSTGHIAFINKIERDAQGNVSKFYLTESNAVSPKTVTHSRAISADSVKGFARVPFKDGSMNFGSDARPQQDQVLSDFANQYANATTATERGAILGQAEKSGYAPKRIVAASSAIPVAEGRFVSVTSGRPIALEGKQEEVINETKDLVPMLSSMLKNMESGKLMAGAGLPGGRAGTGMIEGRLTQAAASLGFGSQEADQLIANISDFNSRLFKIRSGAAVSPTEAKRLSGALPDMTADEDTNRRRIISFAETLMDISAERQRQAGITQTGEKILVKKKSDGQLGEIPSSEFKSTDYELVLD